MFQRHVKVESFKVCKKAACGAYFRVNELIVYYLGIIVKVRELIFNVPKINKRGNARKNQNMKYGFVIFKDR